jgi:hypothetical protein
MTRPATLAPTARKTQASPKPARKATAKPRAPKSSKPTRKPPFQLPAFYPSTQYFNASRLPWPSLLFLLPLMCLYEVGTRAFAFDPVRHTEVRIIAFNLMQDFFHFFGAYGRHLPALAVVGILLSWHVARNDPWKFAPSLLPKMAGESAFLGLPVILLSALCAHHLPLSSPAVGDWKTLVVLSVGAGIYEELLFRMIGFTLLTLLFVDILKLRKTHATVLIVLIPAVLFSAYHYLGHEHFTLQSLVFRTLAGIYFGIIFLHRGFGITAGSHAAYDVFIVLLAGRSATGH